jgi:cytochrome c peroxidase
MSAFNWSERDVLSGLTLGAVVVLSAVAAVAGCGSNDPVLPSVPTTAPTDAGIAVLPDSSADAADGAATTYDWNLPPGFPTPVVPADNPMSAAKVALGRRLFYDKRLSKNGTQSCASCHQQNLAFTDGRASSLGSTGNAHPRSSMSLANVAFATTLAWANPLQTTLERQALVPMFGDDPVELGLTSTPELEATLRSVPLYVQLFQAAFAPDPNPVTLDHVVKALASFERTIISGRSPYDRWLLANDRAAMSESAKRGYALFNGEKFECFHCHVGFAFTDHVSYAGKAFRDRPYHNTGLYNLGGAYPVPNTGVESVTRIPSDMGRFKAPTLRNIAVTAPYMHDGSIGTLEAVLDHYAAGGRTIPDGPNAGVGSANPYKDPIIRPFSPSAEERADVIEFLKALTDDTFLTTPDLSDPW